MIVAHRIGAAQARVDALALAYLLLRVVHIALHLRNKDLARSAVWTLAFTANMALFFVSK